MMQFKQHFRFWSLTQRKVTFGEYCLKGHTRDEVLYQVLCYCGVLCPVYLCNCIVLSVFVYLHCAKCNALSVTWPAGVDKVYYGPLSSTFVTPSQFSPCLFHSATLLCILVEFIPPGSNPIQRSLILCTQSEIGFTTQFQRVCALEHRMCSSSHSTPLTQSNFFLLWCPESLIAMQVV